MVSRTDPDSRLLCGVGAPSRSDPGLRGRSGRPPLSLGKPYPALESAAAARSAGRRERTQPLARPGLGRRAGSSPRRALAAVRTLGSPRREGLHSARGPRPYNVRHAEARTPSARLLEELPLGWWGVDR